MNQWRIVKQTYASGKIQYEIQHRVSNRAWAPFTEAGTFWSEEAAREYIQQRTVVNTEYIEV